MCGRISCADPELGGRYKGKPFASRASKLLNCLIQNVIECVAGLAALILSREAVTKASLSLLVPRSLALLFLIV